MDKREYRRQRRIKEDWEKHTQARLQSTVQCKKCGHKILISADKDYRICNWCNSKVYNDTKTYFMRKMKTLMKEGEQE